MAAVLQFHGVDTDLARVRACTPVNPDGGTLAPYLGRAALAHGLAVRCHPFAVGVFDPTWWNLPAPEILRRLRLRTKGLPDGKLRREHEAWLAYVEAGGQLSLGELLGGELVAALDAGHPLICGLSITWLYQEPRERPSDNADDDIHGAPVGHFVVITGYTDHGATFFVTDPWPQPPFDRDEGVYTVSRRRLTHAILLGDATHDAAIVEVLPRGLS
jgi:hypothetical protein